MKKIMFNDKYCLTQEVLAGRKTMTRRIEKPTEMAEGYTMEDVVTIFHEYSSLLNAHSFSLYDNEKKIGVLNPRYQVGEVVAIAQCYKELYPYADFEMVGNGFMTESAGWNNKMFVRANLMKRHIRITDVKVERLQDISDDDIMREGVWQSYDQKNLFHVSKSIGYALDVVFLSARKAFTYLIDMVSGEGTWIFNPWVVAYSFELVD
ncbi:hypothetical protein KZO62_05890 [Prevotella melaninogenica]|uniref:hypothetical protein n=1 Tax=Prevotella melaninogenica TaxID=28132 RepID=UPI001C5F1D64|nr:hypothetical protein [Prevotella melaninogenica]MBW4731416.1 hypothetical protein [Prevotella melaninogenica]